MQKNLEQIRAATALNPAKSLDKAAINKLPAMIINNGLLATTAFCISDSNGKNRTDMAKALDETAKHLAGRAILTQGTGDAEAMIKDLSARDSYELQRATAEALAFIGYLRRFAQKSKNPSSE
jgi:CRISPR-associated protein Cmr5